MSCKVVMIFFNDKNTITYFYISHPSILTDQGGWIHGGAGELVPASATAHSSLSAIYQVCPSLPPFHLKPLIPNSCPISRLDCLLRQQITREVKARHVHLLIIWDLGLGDDSSPPSTRSAPASTPTPISSPSPLGTASSL
jgi:hypothetical protein